MLDIIIVGAGGFGREALYLAKAVIEYNNYDWQIKGLIDDNLHALDGKDCDYKVIGTIKDWVV
ncbi:MAG: sugar O-acyltransferase, partial [Rikenellaceae bacterium]|nr:sugar O-acyltransferase [Rikenellaceae bacterium]